MSNHPTRRGKEQGEETLFVSDRLALFGGIAVGVAALVGQMLVGFVYNGFEAHDLLQALIPPAQSFGGAVVQASATILALMLTLLSLSRREIDDLEPGFFHRIDRVAELSSITLAAAILLLLLFSIPLQQSKTLPVNWFQIIYYVLVVVTAAIAGLVVMIVIMLYTAIKSIVQAVRPDERKSRH